MKPDFEVYPSFATGSYSRSGEQRRYCSGSHGSALWLSWPSSSTFTTRFNSPKRLVEGPEDVRRERSKAIEKEVQKLHSQDSCTADGERFLPSFSGATVQRSRSRFIHRAGWRTRNAATLFGGCALERLRTRASGETDLPLMRLIADSSSAVLRQGGCARARGSGIQGRTASVSNPERLMDLRSPGSTAAP